MDDIIGKKGGEKWYPTYAPHIILGTDRSILDFDEGDIPTIIAQFLEKMAVDNNLDVQDVLMWYDKRSGVLEVITRNNPPTIIGKVMLLNDL